MQQSTNKGIIFLKKDDNGNEIFRVKVKPEEKQSYADAIKQQIQDFMIRNECLKLIA